MQTRKTYSEEERVKIAESYLEYGTVREAGQRTDVPKTTVHSIVRKFIATGNFSRVDELKELIECNLRERHLRGGHSTALKFRKG